MTAAADMSRAASVSGGDVLLEARQVRKYFPIHAGLFGTTTATIKAVDGIDFVVCKGETFGLVGESGCGKSTTSRLLLRLEAPTSGEILFDGKEIASLAGTELQTYRRALQAVFQDPTTSLSPRMRVLEIVGEPVIANEDVPRREMRARVTTVLNEVGLPPDAGSRYPHEFS